MLTLMKLSEVMDAPNELSVRIIGQKGDHDNTFPLLTTFVSMMDMFLELVENPEHELRNKEVDWVDVRKTEVVIKVY